MATLGRSLSRPLPLRSMASGSLTPGGRKAVRAATLSGGDLEIAEGQFQAAVVGMVVVADGEGDVDGVAR